MNLQKTKINGRTAFIISKDDIEAIRAKTLQNSLKAKIARPETYRELKGAINEASSSRISIDGYYSLAKKIAGSLRQLTESTPGTIFYHPYKNINPDIYGSPQDFTRQIKALLKEMEALDEIPTGVCRQKGGV